MKRSLILSLALFYTYCAFCQLYTGSDPISQGKLHVVYSGMNMGPNLSMISNIYVFKGIQDTIWIFGSGLGDKEVSGFPITDTCDIRYYMNKRTGNYANYPRNSALHDARIVDTIIVQEMGVNRTDAVIQFLVPHLHADHVNQEFFTALDTIGYQMSTLTIYVDIEDSMGTACNQPCCGIGTCDTTNQYFAAPYDIPWDPSYLNKIKAIGSVGDTCNISFWNFNTELGVWDVSGCVDTSMGGHTQGTINLDNHTQKLRLLGSNQNKYAQCDPIGSDWTELNIHSNITYVAASDDMQGVYQKLKIYPNPSNGAIYFDIQKSELGATIMIYDLKGSQLRAIKFKNDKIEIDGLENGLYLYLLTNGNTISGKGKFVVEKVK